MVRRNLDAPLHGVMAHLVRRPVTVLMLFLTLVGTGVLAYLRIPLTLLPEGFSGSSLHVFLPYPGSAPVEAHDHLARPVEDALRTVPGIRRITSTSSEGNVNVSVRFGPDVDMDVAYGEVRERIERIRPQLPSEMARFSIWRWNPSSMPVLWMGIQYDPDAPDPFAPIEKIVVPRIEAVDGVAVVDTYGIVDKAVRVYVDVDKTRGYGVSLYEVIQQLQADNFVLPAGQVDDGQRTFNVRFDARYADIDDIRQVPIREDLRLEDIADVQYSAGYREYVSRLNGRPDVSMSVAKESAANTVDVCRAVEELIEQLEDDPRLAGIDFNLYFSQKDLIMRSLGALQSSALWGGLFAVVVLWLFLRSVRMTLIAALAIPSALLAGLVAVYFAGATLNLLTLTGFTLAIGMLVDNAVVVIENIARKRALGASPLDAAAAGTGEVGVAVLTATLTSISVFLPLMFMDGDREMRVSVSQVGLPIADSLVASLLVAMIVIPTFAGRLLLKQEGAAAKPAAGSGRLKRVYRRLLEWVLGHRFAAVLLALLTAAAAGSLSGSLKSSRGGGGGPDSIWIDVDTPSTYTLSDVDRVFRRLEEVAGEHMDEIGYRYYSASFTRRGGNLRVWPAEDIDEETREEMPSRLREILPTLPGVTLRVEYEGGEQDPGIRYEIEGRDSRVLAELTAGLKERLEALTTVDEDGEAIPLLENVATDIDEGRDEIRVSVDRDRASDLAVSSQTIQGTVAWGLGGQRLPDLAAGGRDVRVQIEYDKQEDESLRFLENLGLWRDSGGTVPLQAVADIRFAKGPSSIRRVDGRTSMGVSAKPAIDNLYLVSRRVEDVLEATPMPDGYSWREDEGWRQFQADLTELFKTLGLSLVLVYLLLAILLESATLPWSIMLTVPGAAVGVILTLFVFRVPMGPMVVVGGILLVGIVVNNAIVMLDHVQRLRHAGMSRHRALMTGCDDRVRPILMTSLTTIFGLLPVAMPQFFPGSDGERSGYESMAAAVAGGLACSTVLTLLVVPLFYTLFDDLGQLVRRVLGIGRAPAVEPIAEPAD